MCYIFSSFYSYSRCSNIYTRLFNVFYYCCPCTNNNIRTNFNIILDGCSNSYKDKQSGEWKETTEWHNVVLWQRTAEIAGEYLKKGSKVYIEGRLQTRSWDDKTSGQKKYMTEVVANELVLLGGRGEGGGEGGGRGRGQSGGADSYDQSGPDAFDSQPAGRGTEITDDDIPF